MSIHNEDSVETLGKDYGVKGIDGTGPWCFDVAAAHGDRAEAARRYKWGPSMYQNKGPVKFEKLSIKIVPEDSARVAAMMSGQFDVTHQIPIAVHRPGEARRTCEVQGAPSPTSS